jgi:glycosyltransferase involved in cell wall biosynthesis
LRKCLAGLSLLYEALLVDDGSTDGTAASLQAFAASWPECTVVRLPQNQGQAAALLAGFSRARGEIIVTLDGDGQNDPADIPLLLDALAQADMVAGVRSERRDSLLRRGMSRLANAVRRWLLKDGVVDTGCALKAFRREVLGAFIPISTLYSFMPALAASAGFRVLQVPVRHWPRLAGTSKYGLGVMAWRPFIDMLGVFWFGRRRIKMVSR